MILFLWWLLTLPSDRIVCTLWTAQLPTREALVQSCGTDAIGSYRMDVRAFDGSLVCTAPASNLAFIVETCNLISTLDHYDIEIIEPDHVETLCSISTPKQIEPTADEVLEQCPTGWKMYQERKTKFQYEGTRLDQPEVVTICKPPALPVGLGQLDQPARVEDIATDEKYYLLAGRLIWYGYAKAQCPGGYSGVDPITLAATVCGMEGARAQMIAWQNGMDVDIYNASLVWNVPPRVLKMLIAKETQFWPWTGLNDEHGLIQITEDGAELVLQIYSDGYYKLTPEKRYEARRLWLRKLDCHNCTPRDAYDHAREVMPLYAQALAAYYCVYGDWVTAVRVWNEKHRIEG